MIGQVAFGEHVRVVGADQALGGWEVGSAPEMRWGEGHRWSVHLELPEGFESEYKLVHCMPGKPPVWEHTPNRLLTIAAPPSQEDLASSPVEVELQWCSPPHAISEPVEMAVADTLDANDLPATTPAFKVGPLFESFSSGESGSISVTDVEEGSLLADQEKEKERVIQVPETTTVLGAIDAAIMSAEEERIEDAETNSVKAIQQESAFKSAAKTAGAVALGVAGAALLSALAIDVADTAIMGAVAVAAGSAALSGSSSSKKKTQKDEEMETLEESVQRGDSQLEGENRATSTEPGVIIAAGIMSALDAGKAVVKSFDKEVERDEE
jgi:hypothetical protein